MANRLYPTHNSNNDTFKYRINCQSKVNNSSDTEDWLELLNIIPHTSPDYKLFNAMLEKEKEIVVKIGPSKLKEEYKIGKQLVRLQLPTFLDYYCIFNCLENFKTLNNSSKYLCKDSGENVTILVMPTINLGSISNYNWNRDNFNILLNVIKHVILSVLYAYDIEHFIHGDLHLGNVLLKKTKRKNINYGELGSLKCMGIIPVIMDYDKSYIKEKSINLVYDDIIKFINLTHSDMYDIRIDSGNIMNTIYKLLKYNKSITYHTVIQLLNEIDTFSIRFFKSELKQINFTKPNYDSFNSKASANVRKYSDA